MRRAFLIAALLPFEQKEKVYPDGRGHNIRFLLGDRSFADEVVSFEVGKPVRPKS